MPTINVNQTNASETAKGIVEEATQAEVNAGTDTGGTGARLFVIPSKLLSVLGSYLTTASAAATYQTIAGLFTSVMGLVLTGFAAGANTAVAATDTLAQALAKFQGQINARATTSDVALKLDKASVPCDWILACSDLTTALTTGTTKGYFDAPYAFTLTEVIGTLLTAQTSGSIFTIDVNKNGTTVLSTKITIDNTETSSITAVTPPVISVTSFAKGDRITIDIDQLGDGTAKGLEVQIIGTHSV